jgi:hypothetical protein
VDELTRVRQIAGAIWTTKNGQARATLLPPVAVEALQQLRRVPMICRKRVFCVATKVKSKDAKSAPGERWKKVRTEAGFEMPI